MNKVIFTITSMLLALGAEAALQHRYIFNESVMDVKGDHGAKPSKLGAYTEVPLYVDDVPRGSHQRCTASVDETGYEGRSKEVGFFAYQSPFESWFLESVD
tara:strand:+ start:549 stop:851 length:303 start_codon:yes stop_codon:yes gene_type:complete